MKGKPGRSTPEMRRAWCERNPEKIRAYHVFKNAIRTGRLVRPDACEDCGRKPGVNSRGRSLIQGHHDDYAEPLIVRWLCVGCHRRMDRLDEMSERAVV